MTVSTTTLREDYIGDGVTTVFPYNFVIFDETDLVVLFTGAAENAVEQELVLNLGYTVQGVGNPAGGTITLGSASQNGILYTILRRSDYVQNTDYSQGGPFPAESHERALDRLTMQDQELKEVTERSLRAPRHENIDGTLPTLINRKNKVLSFTETGEPSVTDPVDLVNSQTFGSFVVDTFSIANGDYASGQSPTLQLSQAPNSQNNTMIYEDGSYMNKEDYLLFSEDFINILRPVTASVIEVVQGQVAQVAEDFRGADGVDGIDGRSFNTDAIGTYFEIFDLAGTVADNFSYLALDYTPPQVQSLAVGQITVRVALPSAENQAMRGSIDIFPDYYESVFSIQQRAGSTVVGVAGGTDNEYLDFTFSMNDAAIAAGGRVVIAGVEDGDASFPANYNHYDILVSDYISTSDGTGSFDAAVVGPHLFFKDGAAPAFIPSIDNFTNNGNSNVPSFTGWRAPFLFGGGDAAEALSKATTNQSDIAALTTRVTTAETDINSLEINRDFQQGQINTNAASITNLDTRLTSAEADIDALEAGGGGGGSVAPIVSNATSVWTGSANTVTSGNITGGITAGTYIIKVDRTGSTEAYAILTVPATDGIIHTEYETAIDIVGSYAVHYQVYFSPGLNAFATISFRDKFTSGDANSGPTRNMLQIWRVNY